MILTDAGPLIAIVDRGEQHHEACVGCLTKFTAPMLTSWPAFTEAMYFLGEAGGWHIQETLWTLCDQGKLEIADHDSQARLRMHKLMEKYQDCPMDLADASLVVLAEDRGLRDIFTLDQQDFSIYRIHGKQPFRIWPQR